MGMIHAWNAVDAQGSVIASTERVMIPAGWGPRGTSPTDVLYATRLCLHEVLEWMPNLQGGCPESLFADETPMRQIWLRRFSMDRTEVTHDAWRRCMYANVCAPPRTNLADPRISRLEHPVVGITWVEAQQYCEFVGGRLPTEAEWERAARGHEQRVFPWGRTYNDRLANHGRLGFTTDIDGVDGYRYAAPVASFPSGASPFGALDMAGNVWEWTQDHYREVAYAELLPRANPVDTTSGEQRVIRGGSWRSSPYELRVTFRKGFAATSWRPDVGFRCAYDE